jgi:2-hydroxy-3-oxopropionate reductase
MSESIGFIGLGIMGKPMARNLLRAGFALTVHNRSRPALEELAAAGASVAATPAELARRSDVIITMLPDGPDVAGALLGPEGALAAAAPGTLLIDMSTIAPATARRLAAAAAGRGRELLDAPVSGGDKGAIAATLSIMVGGEPAAFERALPIFRALGGTITHCGPSGAGQVVKACNQAAVALSLAAAAEALALGRAAGVDPAIVLRVLGGGLAQSRAMELRGPGMAQDSFVPGFRAGLHRKDLGIVADTAAAHGVELPFSALAAALFDRLIAAGHGDRDHSALLLAIEGRL